MNALYKIKTIDSFKPQPELISEAAYKIKQGRIILFPTRCLYGLGVDAFNTKAVEKLFKIKKRPEQKPILILIHDKNQLNNLVNSVPDSAQQIINHFWPGRVTIVFHAKNTLPDVLTAGTGKIGIRLCEHIVALELVKKVGSPVTGTSANVSGHAGCVNVSQLDSNILNSIDMGLDAGQLKGGKGSTVVDITENFPKILRDGAVSGKKILSLFS